MQFKLWPCHSGERQSENSHGRFLDALIWAQKLGVAARMGAQVIMRQPDLHGLLEPTPVSTNIRSKKSKEVPLHAMEALGGREGIDPNHSRLRH
jgi:hypothetical protein